MKDLVLNPKTQAQLEAYLLQPSHAIALIGMTGSGKGAVAAMLAAKLLRLPAEQLENYPYFHRYSPVKKTITIEMAREITGHMKLKTTGAETIRRVIIIEGAQFMTREAQNALLKIIEEPPADTVLILTISNMKAVLPTIASRVQAMTLYPPAKSELTDYFADKGYAEAAIARAYLVSSGLPGLMQALLDSDTEHPLSVAIEQAKVILQADTFQRLTMIDDIAKQKQQEELLFAIKQIAHSALTANARQPGKDKALERWTLVLASTQEAQDMLGSNAQTKLVLTNLFLNL